MDFRMLVAGLVLSGAVSAAPLTVTVRPPPPGDASGFRMGAANRPDGTTISVDSRSLRRDGRPWTPVMGEFHFSRYPENEWREELLKMKSGGIDIVATYVFWIHHEEVEGAWDWSGRRNLRAFVGAVRDAGLEVIVRCGPWCHGEVRNGGIPDWVLQQGLKVRTDDPAYLDRARVLYGQIAEQLRGLLWKDGGPVIGIQLENEYRGPAEHLLALKAMARDAGLDVPLYTRTGWPELRTPMPFGEILPLYGVYAEGFWDREIGPMPGRYWSGFHFSLLRVDANIANEALGRREVGDPPDIVRYPYLTCEIGGGMMSSYHRRIRVEPADVEATTLVKLGSGGDSLGYYMYHGGTNPEGRLGTLMEAQDTAMTNWNDMPVKNYDFQAPLGEYGQVRPHYHLLRRMHLFLRDFGRFLATTETVLPDRRPGGREDLATLRWAVRTDGRGGLLFVNNFERGVTMPAKPGVQFALGRAAGELTVPLQPVTIPAGSRFFWPFDFDLGRGVRLIHATAQPICAIEEEGRRTVFFAQTAGVPAEFLAAGESRPRRARPGLAPAFSLRAEDGAVVDVVLLDEAASLRLYKAAWQGRERVFLTAAGLAVDGAKLRLTASDPADLACLVYPAPAGLAEREGMFARIDPPRAPRTKAAAVVVEPVRSAGPPREIPPGRAPQPVAAAPDDADFERAAVWRIRLPAGLDLEADPLLRIRYVGDVARVRLNGRLIADDFYNGDSWEIGLRRHAPAILGGVLEIAILPLRADAVSGASRHVYLAERDRPDFGGSESIVALRSVDVMLRHRVEIDDLVVPPTPPQPR